MYSAGLLGYAHGCTCSAIELVKRLQLAVLLAPETERRITSTMAPAWPAMLDDAPRPTTRGELDALVAAGLGISATLASILAPHACRGRCRDPDRPHLLRDWPRPLRLRRTVSRTDVRVARANALNDCRRDAFGVSANEVRQSTVETGRTAQSRPTVTATDEMGVSETFTETGRWSPWSLHGLRDRRGLNQRTSRGLAPSRRNGYGHVIGHPLVGTRLAS